MFFFFSLSFAFFIFAYKTLRKRVWVRISNIGVPSWISWRLIPKSAVFTLKRFKGDYPRTLYHEADFLQMKFFLINSLSLRRWLGRSYNHVVFVFDINVCNFRFDTQICSRRWGSGNDCMKDLVSSLFSNSSPRFQNGGTRPHRSNGLLFGPASSVSLVGISLCQGGKYLL